MIFADTSGGKSWSVGNQSRRPFSYAFGTEAPTTHSKPISPRNVSNSSASVYPQTTTLPVSVNQNGSQTSRAMYSGTNNSSQKGGNFFGNGTDSNMNSSKINNNNGDSLSNSKPVFSPTASFGVSQSYNTTTRNSLFGSSQQKGTLTQNDLFSTKDKWSSNGKSTFGAGTPNRQNKSFW